MAMGELAGYDARMGRHSKWSTGEGVGNRSGPLRAPFLPVQVSFVMSAQP